MNGHITLDRKILEWEWYTDTNTKIVFIHLLLTACWKDTRWQGRIIKRGQLVTSIPSLCTALSLSTREVRTALSHLCSTGEIDRQTTAKYSVITVLNYDLYQTSDSQTTVKRQTKRQSESVENDRQNDSQNLPANGSTARLSEGEHLSSDRQSDSQTTSKATDRATPSEEYKKEEIYISCANDSHDRETKTIDERKKYNFEIIYKAYPKKVGKQGALDHYLGWISAKGRCINGRYRRLTNEQIFAAVKKYVKQMQDEEKELQFYQGFDRFMNKTILDYVEDT
jgi:hypothetical protein